VGFSDVSRLQRWLADAQALGFATTFFWHEHYALCPSPHLLNQRDQYCDLPDAETCAGCLRANPHLVTPRNAVQRIEVWRSAWHDVLVQAKRCIVFSNDSAAIIARAFDSQGVSVNEEGTTEASGTLVLSDIGGMLIHTEITPHDMGYFPEEPVALSGGPIVIGIFGHIATHKGAEVVHALGQAICARQSTARIALFGSIDTPLPKGSGRVYGPYTPNDLPRLVEAAGVNVVLFPSIWPETFSYVCHEAMRMALPLVCFDLGAQAEAVRTYPRGTVLPLCSGVDVLAEIEAFINQHDEWFSAS
jgi:glycosyltransferase involved in cell wall biosynthesis